MHVNAKKMAFTGVLAAFAVILLVLSAVIPRKVVEGKFRKACLFESLTAIA